MRRRSGQMRKAIRLTTYGFLCAVRASLDREERTCQRGQRARTCRCEWGALWGADFGVGVGVSDECGRVGVQEGACAALAPVELTQEGIVDHA